MPPQFLIDISTLDLSKVVIDRETIREMNPHRFEMELLEGVVHLDTELECLIGFHDVSPDGFWARGHVPGRPLFPGVLMIELAAQLASFYTKKIVGWKGFVGFGGVDNCKFRQQVVPGQRLYVICQKKWQRHGRIGCATQGMVDGNLVFEAEIVGVVF